MKLTKQEAIKNLENLSLSLYLREPYLTSLEMAVEALRKETPQPPRWRTDLKTEKTYPTCPECGQKIELEG